MQFLLYLNIDWNSSIGCITIIEVGEASIVLFARRSEACSARQSSVESTLTDMLPCLRAERERREHEHALEWVERDVDVAEPGELTERVRDPNKPRHAGESE